MPSGPCGFYGPLPSSEYTLAIVDAYSRFTIAEIVRSTAAPNIIPKLDHVFVKHFGSKAGWGPFLLLMYYIIMQENLRTLMLLKFPKNNSLTIY